MKIQNFIWEMWSKYKKLTPYAKTVQEILNFKADDYFNDHIAFRTIKHVDFGKEKLAQPFIDFGWEIKSNYHFTEKKLDAIHLEHRENDQLPKIFISELRLKDFDRSVETLLLKRFDEYKHLLTTDALLHDLKGEVEYKTYKYLASKSEYASWLYLHGIQVNHFTVYINNYPNLTLESFVETLKEKNIPLNESGGVIKGNKNLGLIQASTLANSLELSFADQNELVKVPTCYVEFAQRFLLNGQEFKGFITNSADKIFESTNHTDGN